MLSTTKGNPNRNRIEITANKRLFTTRISTAKVSKSVVMKCVPKRVLGSWSCRWINDFGLVFLLNYPHAPRYASELGPTSELDLYYFLDFLGGLDRRKGTNGYGIRHFIKWISDLHQSTSRNQYTSWQHAFM